MTTKNKQPTDSDGIPISKYRKITSNLKTELKELKLNFNAQLAQLKSKNKELAQKNRTISSLNSTLKKNITTLKHQINANKTNDKKNTNKQHTIDNLQLQVKNLNKELNLNKSKLISYVVPSNLIQELSEWITIQHNSTEIDIKYKYVNIPIFY